MKITKHYFHILTISLILVLSACGESNTTSPQDQDHHEHTSETTLLKDGVQWTSDSSTYHNVENLRLMAANFKNTTSPSINDYHLLAASFNNEIQQMINNSTMKGDDHEALHEWMEPLLKDFTELKQTSNVNEARETYTKIQNRIEAFFKYFKS